MILTILYRHYYWVGGPPSLDPKPYKMTLPKTLGDPRRARRFDNHPDVFVMSHIRVISPRPQNRNPEPSTLFRV